MSITKIKNTIYFGLTTLIILSLFELSGCSMHPKIYNSDNACAIFAQQSGFFNNWYKYSKKASLRYKIPLPILLATIKAESSFRATARTKTHKILGFIPWGHISSAYGYSQALNGTWREYQKNSGNSSASRSSFADSINFVAWYYRNAVNHAHINPNDAYSLYIAYVIGWDAFKHRGVWGASASIRTKAKEVAMQAQKYHIQLRSCIEYR